MLSSKANIYSGITGLAMSRVAAEAQGYQLNVGSLCLS
tara:strand:+ start:244 stop:357 length:114 start_codon:yes stop_codon:yes gene_type:complete